MSRRSVARTVLFVQEGGGGATHLTRLLAFAKALQKRRFNPVFAVDQTSDLSPLRIQYPVLYVPPQYVYPAEGPDVATLRANRSRRTAYRNIAMWLLNHHFKTPENARYRLRIWDDLLRAVDPVGVVSDYSFHCLLATAGRLPHVWVSDGHSTPPKRGNAFASYHEDPGNPSHARMRAQTDVKLTELLNEVRRSRGWSVFDGPYGLVEDCLRLVCTVPELDHPAFRYAREEPYCRPATCMPKVSRAPRDDRRFLAYLSSVAGVGAVAAKVVQSLANSKTRGTLVFPGLISPTAEVLAQYGVELSENFVDYGVSMPKSHLVVHYGGIGTALAAVFAGRPQLVLPTHVEQEANASCLDAAGVARVFSLDAIRAASLARGIREALYDDDLAEHAHALARRVRTYDLVDPFERALAFLA